MLTPACSVVYRCPPPPRSTTYHSISLSTSSGSHYHRTSSTCSADVGDSSARWRSFVRVGELSLKENCGGRCPCMGRRWQGSPRERCMWIIRLSRCRSALLSTWGAIFSLSQSQIRTLSLYSVRCAEYECSRCRGRLCIRRC